MLRGLTNVSFWADDVDAATRWYAELLGIEPYFVRPEDGPPAYVEFRLGDHQDELGLIDRRYAPPDAAAGPQGESHCGSPGLAAFQSAKSRASSFSYLSVSTRSLPPTMLPAKLIFESLPYSGNDAMR